MEDKGRPLPKFGEWDVNDPASAEGFTVIFNKARDEKKTGGKPDSPGKVDPPIRQGVDPAKPQPPFFFDVNGCKRTCKFFRILMACACGNALFTAKVVLLHPKAFCSILMRSCPLKNFDVRVSSSVTGAPH
ncbi:protein NOI4 [Citrus sinensis]|nr:protein NOI4 [Citrus sinensis]